MVQLPNNCFPRRYDGVGKNLTETDQKGRVGQCGLSSGEVDQSSTYERNAVESRDLSKAVQAAKQWLDNSKRSHSGAEAAAARSARLQLDAQRTAPEPLAQPLRSRQETAQLRVTVCLYPSMNLATFAQLAEGY